MFLWNANPITIEYYEKKRSWNDAKVKGYQEWWTANNHKQR